MSSAEDLELARQEHGKRLQAVLDEAPTLTLRQSLQSIAVELGKANVLASGAQLLQRRQVALLEKHLELVAAGQAPQAGSDIADQVARSMDLLLDFVKAEAARPPIIHSFTRSGAQIPVEAESDGTRVTAVPPELEE